MNVDNFNGFLKMLTRNKTERPFSIQTLPPEKHDMAVAEKLKELSYLKFGRPREEIQAEIDKMYKV